MKHFSGVRALHAIFGALCLTVSTTVITSGANGAESRETFLPQAIEILQRVPLFDGHNDLPSQYRSRVNYRFSALDLHDTTGLDDPQPMHTDIRRLREGRVGAQWWSVYAAADAPETEAMQASIEQIDFVHNMIERFPEHFALALGADDVERIFAEGRIASLIGMEGGHAIANSLGALRMFHRMGARYMTLTHSRTLDWADAAGDYPRHDGLTDFGEEVVREMNRLGMMVDISHAAPATMRDALRVSEAPVMFSHSNALALNGHPRNVPDDVLELLRDKGGIVMVTFVENFLSEERRRMQARQVAYRAEMEALYPGMPDEIAREMALWEKENDMPKSTLEQVADHIDHIRDLIGSEHIGIGSDFDGVNSLPLGLEDVAAMPQLFAELLSRGYTEEELEKIAGRNMLRVLREAESVSASLRASRMPSELLLADAGSTPAPAPEATPAEAFLDNLRPLCGRAFEGYSAGPSIAGTGMEGEKLVMHVRHCAEDEIQIPLHIGDNRSRTWLITRTESGLRLKHDHRRPDGSDDDVTQYGGDTDEAGTALKQDFPADAFTAELIPNAVTNIWSMRIEPGSRFTYHLTRDGADRATFTFDLSSEVEPPPAPWGYEEN